MFFQPDAVAPPHAKLPAEAPVPRWDEPFPRRLGSARRFSRRTGDRLGSEMGFGPVKDLLKFKPSVFRPAWKQLMFLRGKPLKSNTRKCPLLPV